MTFADTLKDTLDRGYLQARPDLERAMRTPEQESVFELADRASAPPPIQFADMNFMKYGNPSPMVVSPTTRVNMDPLPGSSSPGTAFNDTVRGVVAPDLQARNTLEPAAPQWAPWATGTAGPVLTADERMDSLGHLSPKGWRDDLQAPVAPDVPAPLTPLQTQPAPGLNLRAAPVYDAGTGFGAQGPFDMTEVSQYTGPRVDRNTGFVMSLPQVQEQQVGQLATGYGPQTTLPPINPQGTTLQAPLDYIFNSEARRNKQGQVQVYNLPRADGGGAYEVAGINQKYHPQAAARLKALISEGKYAEAEAEAKAYIGEYTNPVTGFSANPGAEYALRDAYFNRGPGGAYWMAAYAAGLPTDRAMNDQERQAIIAAQQADPEGYLRRLHEAAALYEAKYAGYRPQFARGLQNRWDARLKNSLALLNSSGTVSDMQPAQANGWTIQPQVVTPEQPGIPMGAQNQPVQTFSATLPPVQFQTVGNLSTGSPQMAPPSPTVAPSRGASTYGRQDTGFQLSSAPVASAPSQQSPSPLAAALQGATQVIEGFSDPKKRASTPLGSLFFKGDAASDQPQTNIGSGSVNAMPTNVPAAFGNKTVFSNATGPTGDNQDASMPMWERLFGAI